MNSLRITTLCFVIVALLSGYSCNKNVTSSGVTENKEVQTQNVNKVKIVESVPSSGASAKQVPTPNVNKIKMIGKGKMVAIGKLVITQDASKNEYLTIDAYDAMMPYIVTNVSNNELEIKIKADKSIKNISISPLYNLTVKDIKNIEVIGAVEVELSNIKTNTLDIAVSGSSHITGKIDVATLAVRSLGANSIELNGKADMQKITLAGASKFEGLNLTGKEADLEISGASNVTLNVTHAIDGSVSGISTVSYRNNPVMKATASGVSSINKG